MFPTELHQKFHDVINKKLLAIDEAFTAKDYEKSVILATKLSYWLKAVEGNHSDIAKLCNP